MLPKKQRLPRRIFTWLLKGAKFFQNEVFLLRMANGEGQSRFGFSVSKKISKSAVARNRLRRLGYRLIKPHISAIPEGFLASISYKKDPKDDQIIERMLESILIQSKLIKNNNHK